MKERERDGERNETMLKKSASVCRIPRQSYQFSAELNYCAVQYIVRKRPKGLVRSGPSNNFVTVPITPNVKINRDFVAS